MTGVQPFTGRFGQIWHGAREVPQPGGGRSLALGFCVATVERHFDDRDMIAGRIAAGLNLIERLDSIDRTVADAQRLIDDLTRHIGQMSIPDYSLLVTVPGGLAELRSWLTITRADARMASAA